MVSLASSFLLYSAICLNNKQSTTDNVMKRPLALFGGILLLVLTAPALVHATDITGLDATAAGTFSFSRGGQIRMDVAVSCTSVKGCSGIVAFGLTSAQPFHQNVAGSFSCTASTCTVSVGSADSQISCVLSIPLPVTKPFATLGASCTSPAGFGMLSAAVNIFSSS